MIKIAFSVFFFLISTLSVHAKSIQVVDDSGTTIVLNQPAKKIITLSPGLAELVASAGGLEHIIGVVSHSDFPEDIKILPQVGNYNALDIEKIVLLQPDLIIAWKSGTAKHQIEQLKRIGFTVYISEPETFMDIPNTLVKLGQLMATESLAQKSVTQFMSHFEQLKRKQASYKGKKRKSVFIQIWNQPLMTVNQHHLISKVIQFCGGKNIFAKVFSLTATPSMESILEKNPDIIIATGGKDTLQHWLNRWRQWDFMNAVKNKQLYTVSPDYLVRHTPRILQGIEEVCLIIH